jgi:hypothetical protein
MGITTIAALDLLTSAQIVGTESQPVTPVEHIVLTNQGTNNQVPNNQVANNQAINNQAANNQAANNQVTNNQGGQGDVNQAANQAPQPDVAAPGDAYVAPAEDTYVAPAEDTYAAPANDAYVAPAQDTYAAPANDAYVAPATEAPVDNVPAVVANTTTATPPEAVPPSQRPANPSAEVSLFA